MKFNELHSLIVENDAIDEYDDWTDWLEWNETDITQEELSQLIKTFQLSLEAIIDGKILKLSDDNTTFYLETFPEHDSFDVWSEEKDVEETIARMREDQILDFLGISEENLWIGGWESTIEETRQSPPTVYHYTTEKKWKAIQKEGEMFTSYGTGITNRSASGIFTSLSPEEHAIGSYGDVCLEIDLASFKKENGLSELDINPEPEVLEVTLQNALLNKFGIESYREPSSDMSELTVIVNHSIPVKYIKEI
jgi:hypothetical protein